MEFIQLRQNNEETRLVDLNKFPTTRFYGSKRRLLPWLEEEFSKYNFNTVFDGFGGTSSVTYLLALMGKLVTYNDCFNFNTISANAIFTSKKGTYITKIRNEVEGVIETDGVISRNFKGIFFTDIENQWLDGCIERIQLLKCKSTRNIFYYVLFQACLKKRPYNLFHRSNLNLRLSDVKRSFGNFSTWNKSFPEHINEILDELLPIKAKIKYKPKILVPQNVLEVKPGYDFVYFDPPYLNGSHYSDNYNKKYHFLEGIACYDKWGENINFESKIKELNSPKFIEDWNNPKKFQELLFELISIHKKSIVALSYADNGIPSIDSLRKFFSEQFKTYSISTREINYALSKSSKNEILIVGLPK